MRKSHYERKTLIAAALMCLLAARFVPADEPTLRATLRGHTKRVRCVAISPDGKTLASGSSDNTIRFWDLASGKALATLEDAAEFSVCSLAFSPDGKTLAAGNGGNVIKLWDVATHKAVTLRDEPQQYARPLVVFSADGKMLASGGRCMREIDVRDVASGNHLVTLEGHDQYGVAAITFSADGKSLMSVGSHGDVDQIKTWNLVDGKNTGTRRLPIEGNFAACFSPDRKTLATQDGTTRLWEVATWKERALLEKDTPHTWSIVFSPDGRTLACGDENKTIRLCDIRSNKELATLRGHHGAIESLAFSPDGKWLVSGSADETIKIWDLGASK